VETETYWLQQSMAEDGTTHALETNIPWVTPGMPPNHILRRLALEGCKVVVDGYSERGEWSLKATPRQPGERPAFAVGWLCRLLTDLSIKSGHRWGMDWRYGELRQDGTRVHLLPPLHSMLYHDALRTLRADGDGDLADQYERAVCQAACYISCSELDAAGTRHINSPSEEWQFTLGFLRGGVELLICG